jgi:D-glycero-D-manno-heptose 1,7-bisphosphate phosphatase
MYKALFLDRDGIINIDYGYVSSIEKFEFTQDIFKLLTLFQKKGYLFFIVTNQSGIGRDYYREEDFQILTQWMLQKFEQEGIAITKVHHCPHTPETKCHCRKPAIGMIEKTIQTYNIDLSNSWMIGDKQSDIHFAHNAKIKHTIAIGTCEIENAEYIFTSISECTHFLEENPDIIRR